MTSISRLDSQLKIVACNSLLDRNRVAIVMSIFSTIVSFVILCAYRPHAVELSLFVKWPTSIANGNVICHWDTGFGFNPREWRHDPLLPDSSGQILATKLPSQTVHKLRLRTFYTGVNVPYPEKLTTENLTEVHDHPFAMAGNRTRKGKPHFVAAKFNGKSRRSTA